MDAVAGDVIFKYGKVTKRFPAKDRIKSREGIGVWKYAGKAWKLFNSTKTLEQRRKEYARADTKRLPMGNYQIIAGTVEEDGKTTQGFAIVVRWSRGTFFTFQKSDSRLFRKALEGEGISHSRTSNDWVRINRGCLIAKKLFVRDCQGFVERDVGEPLMFIDVHLGTSSEQAIEMVDIITAWGNRP